MLMTIQAEIMISIYFCDVMIVEIICGKCRNLLFEEFNKLILICSFFNIGHCPIPRVIPILVLWFLVPSVFKCVI